MASTYSTNLALELIGTGDQAGTWGTTTNTNLGTLLEQAISGYVTQAITDGADTVITIPNGASGVARNMFIECTGYITDSRNLIVPANKKLYFIYNNVTSDYDYPITVKVAGQTGVSVPFGAKVLLVCNGTDVVNAVTYVKGTNTASGDALINGVTVGNGGIDYSNTVVGYGAKAGTSSGAQYNVAVGTSVLFSNLDGYDLTAMGFNALVTNTHGVDNTAIGSSAGYALTGYASSNTFIGSQAAISAAGGNYNTAVGAGAFGGSSSTTGYQNSILGAFSGSIITTGYQNAILGAASGTTLTTGYSNTILGFNSNLSSATGNNQIVIGAIATGQGDNYVTIGKGGTNQIYAQFTTSATWTKASDERIKKNIQSTPLGLSFITKLRPVIYNWKPNNEYPKEINGYSEENTQDLNATMYGLIAQEVKAALDSENAEHFAGWSIRESDGLQGVSNEMFVLPLINAVKELKVELDALKAELQTLKGA